MSINPDNINNLFAFNVISPLAVQRRVSLHNAYKGFVFSGKKIFADIEYI